MKIVCEFYSAAEMVEFARLICSKSGVTAKAEQTEEVKPAFSSGRDVEEDDKKTEEAVQESPEKTQPYTLVDVRAKLAELQKSGKRDQVKRLLEELGAGKLSDVPEEKYGLLMEKAGEL